MLTLVAGVMGGSETYARELTKALARVGGLEYRVFVPPGAEDAGGGLPTRAVTEYRATRSAAGRAAAMARAALAPGRLRDAMKLGELEGIHFPFTVMLPPPGEVPAATTILDLQHEEHPEFFSRAQLLYRRRFYRRPLLESDFVITISEHARRTILDRYQLEPGRVRAIHLAVDHGTFTSDGRPRKSFLLYPANAWPHKNHPRLFEAFVQVQNERPELRLVLTGSDHPVDLPGGVTSLGRVYDERLVELYRTAAALVFPSLYEGFGLPPLEAMACACPVAVSRVAALPEVCGNAAVYFDPTSAESIAQGIVEVLDRPPAGGPERAALFTWEEFAHRHDAVYRELAGPDETG